MSLVKLRLCFVLFSIPLFGFSQNLSNCQEIVDLTIESINSKSIDLLKPHLAANFSIAGQQEPIASMVLKQIVEQLDDQIKSYELSSKEKNEEGFVFTYDLKYVKKGVQQTVFIFDNDNNIKELKLFKMEVKTMQEANTTITNSNNNIINVPIKMRGKLILVDVMLEGVKRKFILDTGAPKVILNDKYLKTNYDSEGIIKKISSSKGVNNNISGLDLIYIEELNFHGISMKNQEVLTLDLSNLEDGYEMEIYGLIGFELIKEYDILFNYSELELIMINPKYFKDFEKDNLPDKKIRVPITMEGHLPIVEIEVDGRTLEMAIDCGAEINLLGHNLYTELSNSFVDLTKDTLSGASGIQKEVYQGDLNQTKIGTKQFKNMKTVFSDISHLNESYSLNIHGIIGYELLSRQPTLLSFVRNELLFY